VKLHTVWVASMAQVLQGWGTTYLAGTPASCAPSGGGGGTPPAADKAVSISGMAFSPATLTVPMGTKVTWTNGDSVPHTVTSMGSGPLKSPSLGKGQTYSYTFTQAGTYMYYCSVHPDMHAAITVQ
jgi:plastocyanin